jgi:O-antigen polymerase
MPLMVQSTFTNAISLTLVALIGLTLLNSNVFGSSSLFPYFLYCFFSGCLTIFVCFKVLLNKEINKIRVNLPALLFIGFCSLIWIHGYVSNRLVLPHHYWVSNALFFASCFVWFCFNEVKATSNWICLGVVTLAMFETTIVVLQTLGVIETNNYYFLATGTWNNPNVIAIFLSLSLYALYLQTLFKAKLFINIISICICAAIVLLFCRTAYLVAITILVFANKDYLKTVIQNLPLKKNYLKVLLVTAVLIFIAVAMALKLTSSYARLDIWGKSIKLFIEKPFFGHGFGMFEKAYNEYQALHPSLSNRFVSMPYNDFLEISTEGGIFILIAWVGFLVSLFTISSKLYSDLFPLASSLLIIQLTNFGFNAVPAFLLIILYLALYLSKVETKLLSKRACVINKKALYLPIVISFFFSFNMAALGGSFYNKQIFTKKQLSQATVSEYFKQSKTLNGYSSFHETMGDLFLKFNKYEIAIKEYRLALETSQNPKTLTKLASCCIKTQKTDSAEFLFKKISKIDPSKLNPHFFLLQLYQQQNDSTKVYSQAQFIAQMPIKVRTKRAFEIKKYADSVLNIYKTKTKI